MNEFKVNSENEFEEELLEWLENNLNLPRNVKIDRSRKVAKDSSFIFNENDELLFNIYFSETDIVVFEDLGDIKPSGEKITETLGDIKFLKLSKLNLGKTQASDKVEHLNPESLGQIVYPHIILELKRKGSTTHDYLTYNQKASQFKQMFPNVKIIIIFNEKNDTTEKVKRNLYSFDKIFALKDEYNDLGVKRGEIKKWIENQIS